MRNFLFILASTATLAIVDPAKAQMYLPPTNPSTAITRGYTAPSTTPGYNWREQRANDDWRQRENYEKQRTPNNAADRGYVGKPTDRTTNNPIDTNENKTDTNNNPADKGYVGAR